ncbi:transglycosylase SLT domain-containing protein [Dongia soli]|uniref:Transglycosylase SLT domain-containing protein n=1 Tax=Dongia soli TaxID=600628 RepID=A0ABU5E972_9PROT|nr:transglycosylase SLT domain-containing protein [Dongia soli]MDY0882324.1 transglycosylase SLT domain-containing protein [Dongia soli]
MKCGKILALLLTITAGASWASASWSASPCSRSDYDIQIAAAVIEWWPDVAPDTGFYAWKAQLCQESRLDPRAVSPAGAKGLAQFMPGTWREVAIELGLGKRTAFDPWAAIDAGAYYMAKLRRFPDWRRWQDPERHRMSQASYNAGPGNIRKALRLCPAQSWSGVARCLPTVTGRHALETITYVERIAEWQRMLGGQ